MCTTYKSNESVKLFVVLSQETVLFSNTTPTVAEAQEEIEIWTGPETVEFDAARTNCSPVFSSLLAVNWTSELLPLKEI